ncbi:carbon-monoxide dehydrogenase small subunit [Proteiniborus ethanoligenes]|uniref:Carbon-monoxide dehydrogenase small subunit n=1 Tax=Proteiniborus ethanoligenes TaxID=415015 RepID=A0A1H3ML06_9FIRM|nr:(2Fe-2S)-binding protein [Proteiniborus ethanoligenes]SDY77034.1 carbon-monoxide dehydrogenase small subunit [Proteiniborus ethanoligenes]
MKYKISFTLNNEKIQHEVEPHKTLLKMLREDFDLTGAKEGCGQGECGACTILLDGKPVNSCLVLAVDADGRDILTIEGLSNGTELDNLQASFITHGALQCGYCTPGMVMAAKGLLAENPHPTEEEVKEAISGNLCRCTGYKKIIEAIMDVAER